MSFVNVKVFFSSENLKLYKSDFFLQWNLHVIYTVGWNGQFSGWNLFSSWLTVYGGERIGWWKDRVFSPIPPIWDRFNPSPNTTRLLSTFTTPFCPSTLFHASQTLSIPMFMLAGTLPYNMNIRTNGLPLLGDKQVALIGGQTGSPHWETNRLPLLNRRWLSGDKPILTMTMTVCGDSPWIVHTFLSKPLEYISPVAL